jgi:hypothetical protein
MTMATKAIITTARRIRASIEIAIICSSQICAAAAACPGGAGASLFS